MVIRYAITFGPIAVVSLLVLEGLLLAFAGPIQVVGPNALRLPLADWLRDVLKLPTFSATHLAGVVLDFKKLLVYLCFAYQLYMTRLLLCDVHPSYTRVGDATRDDVLSKVFTWHSRTDWMVGVISLVMVCGVYVMNYWTPSLTGHVWGPVGKGLLANDWPYFQGLERWFLIGYRASYLICLVPIFVVTAITMPGYLRLVRTTPVPQELDDEKSLAKTLAAIDVVLAVPLLGTLGIGILWAAGSWLGAGGLRDIAGASAAIAAGFMVMWLVAGLRRLGNVRVPAQGTIAGRWQVIVRLKGVFASLTAIGVVALVQLTWNAIGKQRAPGHITVSLEAAVLAQAGEYVGWNLGRVDSIRKVVTHGVQPLIAAVSTDDKVVRRLGRSKRAQERTLVAVTMARGMILDLCRSDEMVAAVVSTVPDASLSEWPMKVSVQGGLAVLEQVEATGGGSSMPLRYDGEFLVKRRRAIVRRMLERFNETGVGLLSIEEREVNPGAEEELPEVIRAGCRRLAAAVRWPKASNGASR